ncbi:MAG: crossover junction endodeoxyribonuclease RuvC [Propionibacteriaceae bacterium]|nr:crossover junction endodeoxyribonuclease RuvC [Propionibacteriaceae bacterium]
MGVDPGLTRCGVGVVEGTPGRAQLIEAGVIRTAATMDTSRRLLAIEEGLEEWISRHQVEVIAIERVFAQHNLMTVVGTAQAAGIAMLVAARHGLEVHQHTPSEVKASITGSGRADKAQVGLMVSRILHLDSPPKPADAADAVALAICHSWRGAAVKRLAQVVPSTKRPRSWAQVTSVRKVMA